MPISPVEYGQKIQRAKKAFEAQGFDVQTTLGDAIQAFQRQPGIDPNYGPLRHPRGDFHEIAHILGNYPDASLEAERVAAICEKVWLRGSWHTTNEADESRFDDPLSVPPFDSVYSAIQFRIAFMHAKEREQEGGHFDSSSMEKARQAYDRAVRDEELFRRMTGGRALYQLSAQELRGLPLVFAGLQRKEVRDLGLKEKPFLIFEKEGSRSKISGADIKLISSASSISKNKPELLVDFVAGKEQRERDAVILFEKIPFMHFSSIVESLTLSPGTLPHEKPHDDLFRFALTS